MKQPPTAFNPSMEILTPTGDVDFNDYLRRLFVKVQRNWYTVMPQSAKLGTKGKVVVRFQIQKDGGRLVKEPTIESSSTKGLDTAALSAIRSSAPFEHLPDAFRGPSIAVRFTFFYNLPVELPQRP
jgi:TonB family protein